MDWERQRKVMEEWLYKLKRSGYPPLIQASSSESSIAEMGCYVQETNVLAPERQGPTLITPNYRFNSWQFNGKIEAGVSKV